MAILSVVASLQDNHIPKLFIHWLVNGETKSIFKLNNVIRDGPPEFRRIRRFNKITKPNVFNYQDGRIRVK